MAADATKENSSLDPLSKEQPWELKLFLILTSYISVVFAGYLFVKFVQRRYKNDIRSVQQSWLKRFIRLFALGRPDYDLLHSNDVSLHDNSNSLTTINSHKDFLKNILHLIINFIGIQLTLVCMGFFQERIITQGYSRSGVISAKDTTPIFDKFKDMQFLVLANRLVSLILCGLYLMLTWKKQPVHTQPLYVHSFASISNVISSWCQYEALKYVSFPTQTVCKASKIVPTMIVGKVLRRQRYSTSEYSLAFLLVFGASIFFFSMSKGRLTVPESNISPPELMQTNIWTTIQQYSTIVSGLALMVGYLFFDAFTPNWQKKLFDTPPRISCSQMMFGVNAFSALFCMVSLIQQWTLLSSLNFIITHDNILIDCLLLSLGSACGQVFIYQTVQRFGPVVLSVLMTLRQIFSIILSSFYFSHPITVQGLFGLILVFGAIFVDAYRKYRLMKHKNSTRSVVK